MGKPWDYAVRELRIDQTVDEIAVMLNEMAEQGWAFLRLDSGFFFFVRVPECECSPAAPRDICGA